MVDCERGLGRPEKAIETGLQADRAALGQEERVQLAIAMSGARLDLGQTQQALFELEVPELNPKKAYSWSPDLFGAYATVLEDLGRESESKEWYARSSRAAAALQDHYGSQDTLEVMEIIEHEGLENDDDPVGESTTDPDADAGADADLEPGADAETGTDAETQED